jgi:hypothetical protein
LIGVDLSAWTAVFAPSLLRNPLRIFNFSSPSQDKATTTSYGILVHSREQIAKGPAVYLPVSALQATTMASGISVAMRGKNLRRQGEDADPGPCSEHQQRGEVKFAHGFCAAA